MLIEHHAGRFPLWLAPVQIVVASITSEAAPYAEQVARECAAAGLRACLDAGHETINYKVREHSLAKVPVMLVVGTREASGRTVALRRLGGRDQEALALGEAVAKLTQEAAVPSSS
jgi:threonyl-tRNA synthetase